MKLPLEEIRLYSLFKSSLLFIFYSLVCEVSCSGCHLKMNSSEGDFVTYLGFNLTYLNLRDSFVDRNVYHGFYFLFS